MTSVARFWSAALALLAIIDCHHAWSQSSSSTVTLDADSGGGVQATVKAIPPPPSGSIIPAERKFAWNPGLTSKGGIPNRTSVCATLSPSANIQAALDSCPAGQVVKLNAGTFTVNNYLFLHSGITLARRRREANHSVQNQWREAAYLDRVGRHHGHPHAG